MNIILTGSEGLIGVPLKERLKKEGYDILYEIDQRSGSDITNINTLDPDENTVDAFIHLAAFCKINQSIENPSLAFKNNVKGTYECLEFCRLNGIKKFVFTSSSRVLSKEKNPYTASKIYGEELAKAYKECYGIDYLIIRPSTVYGLGHDLTSRLMTKWVIAGLQNKELSIYGDKNKTLDFTYISDFVNGFMLVINQNNKEFNISGGQETKLIDFAEMIIKETGGGYVKFYPAEIAQPQTVNVDISSLRRLGYEPKVSLEEGVKRVVNWYEGHPKFWKEPV